MFGSGLLDIMRYHADQQVENLVPSFDFRCSGMALAFRILFLRHVQCLCFGLIDVSIIMVKNSRF